MGIKISFLTILSFSFTHDFLFNTNWFNSLSVKFTCFKAILLINYCLGLALLIIAIEDRPIEFTL